MAVGLILALVFGGIAGSLLTASTGWPFGPDKVVPLLVSRSTSEIANQVSFASGFTPVAKAAMPAVVSVASSRVVRAPEGHPFGAPPFHEFFGPFGAPRERREHGLGSGVIVSPDGYILTNNHVVEGASEIKVILSDRREFNARTIGSDPQTDIAVLKVDEANLPTLPLGDSSGLQVGEFVLAIGNPFGVGQTLTMGVVGATGRGGLNIEQYEDFIQTDAAINPGNSGGALVNITGHLVGINTAIISRGGGNQGVGFAVPINMARYVMEQILEHGRVVRGWLGMTIQEVDPGIAKSFGLADPHGALIADVAPDSPASRAGITTGDIITEVNGDRVADGRTLRLKIARMAPGTRVGLKLLRDGIEREVTVTLGELQASERRAIPDGRRSSALQGLAVDELTSDLARQLGLPPGTRGVVIVSVEPGSPAGGAGIRRGDVIQEVNRQPVMGVADFNQAARQTGGEPVLVLINRAGSTMFVVIEPHG